MPRMIFLSGNHGHLCGVPEGIRQPWRHHANGADHRDRDNCYEFS